MMGIVSFGLLIHFPPELCDSLMGNLGAFDIIFLLRFRVFDISDESLQPVFAVTNIEFHINGKLFIEICGQNKGAVFAEHKLIDVLVGFEHVLSDFLAVLFVDDFDESDCEFLRGGGVVADDDEF
jgi:hypothetical protein